MQLVQASEIKKSNLASQSDKLKSEIAYLVKLLRVSDLKKRELSEKNEKLQSEITYLIQLLSNTSSSNKAEVVKENAKSPEKVDNDREVRLQNEITYLL